MGRVRNPINRILMMRKKGLASPYMNNLGYGLIKSGFKGFVVALSGGSEGVDCLGSTPAVTFSGVVSTVGTAANGVTIQTSGGAKTFTVTGASGTGTDTITYTGTWSAAIAYGDVVTYSYDSGTGEHVDANGNPLASATITLTNCEPAPGADPLIAPAGGTILGLNSTLQEGLRTPFTTGTFQNTQRYQ